MGARTPVSGNDRYGAREMRRIVDGHPPLDECLATDTRLPVELNPHQPIATSKVLGLESYDLDIAFPVYLTVEDGRYSPPPFDAALKRSITIRTRRLSLETEMLANGTDAAEVWLKSQLPQWPQRAAPWPHELDPERFEVKCKADLSRRLPYRGQRRNNLNNRDVLRYLINQCKILELILDAKTYFDHIYSTFARVANENFSGGKEGGHEVTLNTLHEAFRCLPAELSEGDVLDMAFHGPHQRHLGQSRSLRHERHS